MIDEFNFPKVMAIVSNANEGKTNLAHHLIKTLKEKYKFKLYTYGFRVEVESTTQIYSLKELEEIRDSVVFVDEFYSLFNLEDRRLRKMIENTLRLIFHNNNILVLIGVCENFKKFISAKISTIFYKKVTFADFINGSSIKRTIMDYKGYEVGSTVLNLKKDEVVVYNGENYKKYKVPYIKDKDSKRANCDILSAKNVQENV